MKFFFTLLLFGGAFFVLPVFSNNNTPKVFAQVEGESCGTQQLGNYCCGYPDCVCNDVLILKWHYDWFAGWVCEPDYTTRSTQYHNPGWMPECVAQPLCQGACCPPPAPTCSVWTRDYDECDACPAGYSRHVDVYSWSDGSGECDWRVGACNQPDSGCCAGNTGQECGTYGCCSASNVESQCYNQINCYGNCSYAGIRNEGAYCGNGACSCNENSSNCPADCGVPPPTCPNSSCDAGENCTTCPQDCGVCPPGPTPTSPPGPTPTPPGPTPTPAPGTGTIRGALWWDYNPQNGTLDGGEPLIGGINVCVNTGVVTCDTTDSSGNPNYILPNIVPGNHTVTFNTVQAAALGYEQINVYFPPSGPGVPGQKYTNPATLLAGQTVRMDVNFKKIGCAVTLSGPPPFYIGQTGQISANVTMTNGSNPNGQVAQIDFTGYSGIISLSQDPRLSPPPYNTIATGRTAGTTNVGATVTLNNGVTCSTASTVPVTVNAPTCAVSLVPNPLGLTQGETKIDGFGASVSSFNPIGTPVDRVVFSSDNPAIATVTSPDTSAAYTSTVYGVNIGSTTARATAYLRDPYGVLWPCPATPASAIINVAPPPPWIQVAGGDAHIQGSLTNITPLGNYFSLVDGTYPQPGVVSVNGSTNFTPGSVSFLGWLLSGSTTGDYPHDDYPSIRYDYDYFYNRVQSFEPWTPTDPNRPTRNELAGLANGFYYVNGDTYLPIGADWSIAGNEKKRIVIFIDGNLTISNRIFIPSGNQSFIAFIVKGNIIVSPTVDDPSGNQAAVSGVYIANGQIQIQAVPGSGLFRGRGIFIAYGDGATSAFDLQRESPNSSTTPAEAFIYDINFVMETFEDFKITPFIWQEVAP